MRDSKREKYFGHEGPKRGGYTYQVRRKTHPAVKFLGVAFVVAALVFLPVSGLGFSMALPVDCSGADICFPQNYYDHDPSSVYTDYRCGSLSYDGHTGTDIRVSYADMERGVPVLAVADGVVRAVRDGEPEGEISLRGKASVKGREAGNAVVVAHADRFETQYSHLKMGSVAVRPGQVVTAGQRLGLVGLSGVTEFPHLEISLRQESWFMDPFTGPRFDGCDAKRVPFWNPAALDSSTLAYRASGLLEAGFFTEPPKSSISMLRRHGWIEGQSGDPEVLVFGVMVFGLRRGDVWDVRFTGPSGQVLSRYRATQERNQAQAMRYTGTRRGAGWKPGRYRGEFRLTRAGEGDVVSVVREIEVR